MRNPTIEAQVITESFGYPYILAVAVIEGHDPTQYLRILQERIVIGRSEEADLMIDDPAVSSKHCVIFVRGSMFEVVDLESRNGTHLNGRPLLPKVRQRLKHLDEIRVGETRIVFTANRLVGST